MTVATATVVVGASGVLAPAARTLVARGHRVTGVSRGARALPHGVEPVVVDARSSEAVSAAFDGREWDHAVVYGPAVTADSLAIVRSLTRVRCVVVRTTAAADPALGPLDVPPDTLQLGWADEPGAAPRWHTPEEISAAALRVLADGEPAVLGEVRPWSDRP